MGLSLGFSSLWPIMIIRTFLSYVAQHGRCIGNNFRLNSCEILCVVQLVYWTLCVAVHPAAAAVIPRRNECHFLIAPRVICSIYIYVYFWLQKRLRHHRVVIPFSLGIFVILLCHLFGETDCDSSACNHHKPPFFVYTWFDSTHLSAFGEQSVAPCPFRGKYDLVWSGVFVKKATDSVSKDFPEVYPFPGRNYKSNANKQCPAGFRVVEI